MEYHDLGYVKCLPEVGDKILERRNEIYTTYDNAKQKFSQADKAKYEFERYLETLWSAKEIAAAKAEYAQILEVY